MTLSQSESESESKLELELESELESEVQAEVELEMQPSMVHSEDQPSGYLVQPVQRHTRTQPTTRRNLLERRCQAQLVPTNRGRMCTLTNENVIPIRCIIIEAVNTNNVLILSIGRQTHVRSKGIGMVIYPLHEFRLRVIAGKVQIGEQPFQICYGALPIHPQTTTCLGEQVFNFTPHTRRNQGEQPSQPASPRHIFFSTTIRHS